jgi:SAM-dependent methyltransferase
MITPREYESYDDYVRHQKEKTTDPVRREKWLGAEWQLKLDGFREIFEAHRSRLGTTALCLGARTGQEVRALLDLGVEAIGIDLVPCEPLVRAGDIHALDFEDGSFDFVFSNVFDHALHADRFVAEIERVCRPSGHILLQFQIDLSQDQYTATVVAEIARDVVPLFRSSEVIHDHAIPKNFAAMNHELLLRRT